MADEKISALPSAGALAGTEPLPIVQGGVTKKTTVQDVANLVAVPTLQQVTTAGATTTNSISVDNGTDSVNIQPNQIKIANGTGYGTIGAANLTADPNFELPDKPTGTYTFAMIEDITGGVASVNSGTNISVDNTDPANPIINSLADRYKTSSITSNTISNGAKTFTVDADLAYIPLQEVLIVNDATHHMHATVTSYSGTTLVVDVTSHTGSGTFIVWVLNLDGVPVDAITGVGTANEIAYFTGGQVIASLPVATYPSLTELSYVKGATSAIQTQLNAKPIQTYIIATSLAFPADSTSYFLGINPTSMFATANRRDFKFPVAHTVEIVSFVVEQSVNGSNETVNIYLRNITTATDYAIGTFLSNFGAGLAYKVLFTGLSIAVNTTDDWAVKILTPAWTTNPTNWTVGMILSGK